VLERGLGVGVQLIDTRFLCQVHWPLPSFVWLRAARRYFLLRCMKSAIRRSPSSMSSNDEA
jgi:hypothetical protein